MANDDGGPANTKSLRDWFAGQALKGLLAQHGKVLPMGSANTGSHDEETAYAAGRYANAMLKERKQGAG